MWIDELMSFMLAYQIPLSYDEVEFDVEGEFLDRYGISDGDKFIKFLDELFLQVSIERTKDFIYVRDVRSGEKVYMVVINRKR